MPIIGFFYPLFYLVHPSFIISTAFFLQVHPMVFWLVVGALLCLLEFAVPTAFTAFMMGISALLVALIARLLPSQIALQVGIWLGLSVGFVVLTHRLMPKRKISSISDATEAETLTEIVPGQPGRVLYEGGSWRAICEDSSAIAPGQKVYVVGRQGTTLVVVPKNLLDS
ncbi:MAG TPA: NfeD family protein [Oculatellaceae cyanobacterium]|jgi:membrane protein implicated in regulation of membrane protease activity